MTHPSGDDVNMAFPYWPAKEMKSISWLLQGEKLHCQNLIEKIGFIALAEEPDVVMDYL